MMSKQTITLTQSDGFSKANRFLEKLLNKVKLGDLDKYGRKGVEALSAATPKDTGLASSSWSYTINRSEKNIVTIEWHNDDVENGFNVILGVQYGHATKSGGWIDGIDFINPAIRPIFEEIRDDIRREVTKH